MTAVKRGRARRCLDVSVLRDRRERENAIRTIAGAGLDGDRSTADGVEGWVWMGEREGGLETTAGWLVLARSVFKPETSRQGTKGRLAR